MKKILLTSCLFIILVITCGCEANDLRIEEEKKAIDACIEQGGVPIQTNGFQANGFEIQIERCEFPPK